MKLPNPAQLFSSLWNIGFPGGSASKESSCNAEDWGSIPGLERSPGEGNSYLLQYSGLENSIDCIVHGATKSQTWLSDFHFQRRRHCREEAGEVMLWLHLDCIKKKNPTSSWNMKEALKVFNKSNNVIKSAFLKPTLTSAWWVAYREAKNDSRWHIRRLFEHPLLKWV